MGPIEPHGQKEGFVVALESLQQLDRFDCGNPVGLLGIRSIVGEPAHRSAELSRPQGEDPVVNLAIAAARVDGEVPRRVVVQPAAADRVRHAVVIQLADARGEPAVRPEELRKGDGLRQLLAEMRRHRVSRWRVRQHAGAFGCRPVSNEDRLGLHSGCWA
jgi:hypothetical protein